MTEPTIKTTNHRGQRKYRLTLHREDMNGIYSRSEIEALRAEIDRILADERADLWASNEPRSSF